MGLLGAIVLLPLAPVRGVVRLAELLEDEARRQLTDPATVRAQLAELDEACANGAISDAERERRRDELVARLVSGRGEPGV
jgi:hypothetical protein